jgi:diguanylate cyclase (GGDEF)-like protein/PAS domain S-box-containing protein
MDFIASSQSIAATHDPVGLIEILLVLVAVCIGLGLLALNRHSAFMEMRKAERSFRDLYDNIGEGVFRSTLAGRMISANPALVRLNGYVSEKEMLASVSDIAKEWYVDPNRRADLHAILERDGRVTNFVSEVYRYKTRERIWIEESTRLVRDEQTGAPLYYDGTVREVTETVRRLELQARHDKITSVVSGCLYQRRVKADGSASMPFVSAGITSLSGLQPEVVMRDSSILEQLVHPDDRAAVMESFDRSARTLNPRQSEYRIRTVDGTEKWVFGHAVPEREPDGSTLWHGYLMDVSERKRSERKIYDLAYFDPLTKLPNRTMLLDGLRQALSTSRRTGGSGALLFIDLDQFKILNDTKGHHIGDLLLTEVAIRLRRQIGERDVVARLGGDEFVILLQGGSGDPVEAEAAVETVGRRVLAVLGEPFMLDGFPFQTSASVGATLFHGEERDIDELLKRADLAMYAAKASGRGSLRFFAPEMQEAAEERLALTTELRDALEADGLALVYQPQFDSEGHCFGVEALIRWSNQRRGIIAPAEFLPLAERSGLSAQLDAFVLKTACATLCRWRDDAATDKLQLSVNISAHQLNQRGFVATVEKALRESGADPRLLTLELTEHVMLDDIDDVVEAMLSLKRLGVRFALDDFGTGYSSLSYLKRLPIDTLKIDQSFVRDLESDPSDRAIVQTVLTIARNLQVSVIAEGVETHVQALLLRQLGCYAYQGYLFARPMPLDDLRTYLATLPGSPVPSEEARQLRA